MRIVMLAPGSRGDVQPHVALGRALTERAHDVTLIADPVFAALAAQNTVAFAGAAFDTRTVLAEEQAAFVRRRNPLALLHGLTRRGAEMAHAWGAAAIPPARKADLLIAGGAAIYMAVSIAEVTGRPVIQSMLQPFFPTHAFPSPVMAPRAWPPAINLLSHHAMVWLFHAMFRRFTNPFRAQLGLAPWPHWPARSLRQPRYHALCAVSPRVVPAPADLPRYVEMTGYWFLDDRGGWAPEPALADFLSAGAPPVYVGFSSIVDNDAGRVSELILAALERSGQRAILARGWGGLTGHTAGGRAFAIDEAPHDRLLPLCAGVMHPGGAGTTAAAIRAGLPQIVAPVMADQPFWADRVRGLGIAALAVPKTDLTVDNLCTALRRLAGDEHMRQRAAILARQLRAEDGLAAAVARIETFAGRQRRGDA